MEEPLKGSLIDELFTYKSEDDSGLKIYMLAIPAEVNDDVRVVSVGGASGGSTKCILLLGETGAGKTTFVNALFNYLFGVKFEDNFRLCVKEQQVQDSRCSVESQTDFITVYKIHRMEGMREDGNFLIIDTPGLADTRGEEEQQKIMNSLENFITSDQGINQLHCLGIVAKAVENRESVVHKVNSQTIMTLLGNYIPEVTNIIATHAADSPVVDKVLERAGLKFVTTYPFDNGILYSSHKVGEGVRARDRRKLQPRWEEWEDQFQDFFSSLKNSQPISLSVLRTKKLFEKSVDSLCISVKELVKWLQAQRNDTICIKEWKLQKENNKVFDRMKCEVYKERSKVEDGHHTHNCLQCDTTCNACKWKTFGRVAGEEMEGCYEPVANFVRVPVLAQIAGAYAAITVGAVVGTVAGVVNEITKQCPFEVDTLCSCGHGTLSDHSKTDVLIKTCTREVPHTDDTMKTNYMRAQQEVKKLNDKLKTNNNNIQAGKRKVVSNILNMVSYLKQFEEESLSSPEPIVLLTERIRMLEPGYFEDAMKLQPIISKCIAELESCNLRTTHDQFEYVLSLVDSVQ